MKGIFFFTCIMWSILVCYKNETQWNVHNPSSKKKKNTLFILFYFFQCTLTNLSLGVKSSINMIRQNPAFSFDGEWLSFTLFIRQNRHSKVQILQQRCLNLILLIVDLILVSTWLNPLLLSQRFVIFSFFWTFWFFSVTFCSEVVSLCFNSSFLNFPPNVPAFHQSAISPSVRILSKF